MEKERTELLKRNRPLAFVVAAISIVTCATTARAQSTTDDADKNIQKDKPARTSEPRFRSDLRAGNATVQTGEGMGPPETQTTRNAPARSPRNIPESTVKLKPGEIPQIEFDTPTYYFGRVRSGTDVHHDFWFTNNGSGPLEILAVWPG